jgi:hypothetical protein
MGYNFHNSIGIHGNFTDAPIFHAWGAAYRQINDALATNINELISEAGTSTNLSDAKTPESLRIIAVWWWALPAIGIPIWAGVVCSALLIGTGIWVLRQGWLLSK